jgi:hypothetical protein
MSLKKFLIVFLILISFGSVAEAYYIKENAVVYENADILFGVSPYTTSAPVGPQNQTIRLFNKHDVEYKNLRLGMLFPQIPELTIQKMSKPKYEKQNKKLDKKWDENIYDWNFVQTTDKLNPYFVTIWHYVDNNQGGQAQFIDFKQNVATYEEKNRKLELSIDKNKMTEKPKYESFNDKFHNYGFTEFGFYYFSDQIDLPGLDSYDWKFNYFMPEKSGKWDLFVFKGDVNCVLDASCDLLWYIDPWWDSNFNCVISLDLNISYLTTDINDAVVLLNFNPSLYETGGCSFDGGNSFRPVDNENARLLPYDFDGNWTATDANVWVRVFDLNGATKDDENINVYYSNLSAPSMENETDVWINYEAVYLFETICNIGFCTTTNESTHKHVAGDVSTISIQSDGNVGNTAFGAGLSTQLNTNFEFEGYAGMTWIMTAQIAVDGQKLFGAQNGGNAVFVEYSEGADKKLRWYLGEGGVKYDFKTDAIDNWSSWQWLAFSCGPDGAKIYFGNKKYTNANTDCPVAINQDMLFLSRGDEGWVARGDTFRLLPRQISDEEARLMLLSEERKLILSVGDVNHITTSSSKSIRVLVPKNEKTLLPVTPFKVRVYGAGIADRNNLNDFNDINFIADINATFYVGVSDVNGLYFERIYTVKIIEDQNVYIIQPYLVSAAEGTPITFYTVEAGTLIPIPNILIRISKQLGDQNFLLMESVETDDAGTALVAMVINDAYLLNFYNDQNILLLGNIELRPIKTEYTVVLDLGANDYNAGQNGRIDINYLPNVGKIVCAESGPLGGDWNIAVKATITGTTFVSMRVRVKEDNNVLMDVNYGNPNWHLLDFNDSNLKKKDSLIYVVTDVTTNNGTKEFSKAYFIIRVGEVDPNIKTDLLAIKADLGQWSYLVLLLIIVLVLFAVVNYTQIDMDITKSFVLVVGILALFAYFEWVSWLAFAFLTAIGLFGFIIARGGR